ncbi:MAG TPA: DUF3347 domain-containing protein [Chitinophagaceae bacterium]|nr:DUF3347 domain-containing protein [Chitinophagaceae bacterium]
MKKIFFSMVLSTIVYTACNSSNNKSDAGQNNTPGNASVVKQQTNDTAAPNKEVKAAASIQEIVNIYLQLKNAFTKDNTNDAAEAGKALETAFQNFDTTVLSEPQRKIFEDIAEDAKEHGEHIGKNGGNIRHQREHFKMLSEDMYDLVKAFGAGQTLYKDFCPMYNNNKGAFWISETKEIKNPYFGKAMFTCGIVKEEIK